jgi:hypothetical protein
MSTRTPSRTITFVREQGYDLDFDEWYSQREDYLLEGEKSLFNSKEEAMKKWNMMCDTYAATQYRVESEDSLEWDDFAAELEEIEDEIEEQLVKEEEKKKNDVECLTDEAVKRILEMAELIKKYRK